MVENFDAAMEKQIAEMGGRKKLLLHVCCAPCAAGCVDRLLPHFDITLFFYNPNIDGEEEYRKRADELLRFASSYMPEAKVIVADYNSEEFYTEAKGLEKEPERGARCERCYRLRLKRAAEYAKENGYDYFATTLTLSPLKDARMLNKIGIEWEEQYGIGYLRSDFKKRGGNLRSKELCNEYNLYRQNYCGCRFGKRQNES